MGAGETFTMPGVIAVGHSSLGDDLAALDALSGKLIFIALSTVDVMLLRDKGFGPYWVLAGAANKALLMPLPCLILHLFHTCSEHISTSVTTGSKLGIITGPTVNPVCFATELFVH